MTETGRMVYEYADEIFSLGAELASRVRSGQMVVPAQLSVGIVSSIPKLVASRILQPAFESEMPVRLVCREGGLERLLGELAVHQLDLVLSDRAIPSGLSVKAFSHALGSSEIAIFGRRGSTRPYEKTFPQSLDKAPILLPTKDNPIRRPLEDWFELHDVSPTLVAEFEDSALMKAFGEAGNGLFPSPTAIGEEVEQMYHAKYIGPATGVVETYFAISPERKLKHPVVLRIIEAARETLQ
jgi:LysR family transcriptional activator of nhaA